MKWRFHNKYKNAISLNLIMCVYKSFKVSFSMKVTYKNDFIERKNDDLFWFWIKLKMNENVNVKKKRRKEKKEKNKKRM